MKRYEKALGVIKANSYILIIIGFVILSHFRNFMFWSDHQTFIFGDTAIYTLYISGLYKHLGDIFSIKDNFLFWNPNYLSVGIPTLALIDMALLYPINVLLVLLAKLLNNMFALFPLYMLSIYFHLILGSIFVYKTLFEHWGLSKFRSLFGALLWTFIGFNSEWLGAGQVLITANYLPISFYFSLNVQKKDRSLKDVLAYYISIALSFIAGYTMVATLTYGFCVLYRILTQKKLNGVLILNILKKEMRGVLLITFPIILPFYINPIISFFYSIRSVLNAESFTVFASHTTDLYESLFPRNTLFNTENKTNSVYLYFSLVGLIILNESIVKYKLLNKRNIIILLLGVLAALISLGKATPLAVWLFYLLPGFNYFRRISVFSLIAGFSFCILITQLAEFGKKSHYKRILVVILYIAYIRATTDIGNFSKERILQSLMVSISVLVLTYIALYIKIKNTKIKESLLILVLLGEASLNFSSKFYANSEINPADIFLPNKLITKVQEIAGPMDRVELITTQYNYTTDYLDIQQSAGYISLASIYGVKINEVLNNPSTNANILRDILGIKYLIKRTEASADGAKSVYSHAQNQNEKGYYILDYSSLKWKPENNGTKYTVYERSTNLPRVYLATAVKGKRQDETVLRDIINESSPKTVFVDNKNLRSESIVNDGNLQIVEYKRNYIRAISNSTDISYVANSTAYYPGWLVRINGRLKLPTQTNWFMMGTYLNKGINIIEFIYIPYGLILGSTYSLLALTYALWKYRKDKLLFLR